MGLFDWITKVNHVDTIDASHINDLQTHKLDKSGDTTTDLTVHDTTLAAPSPPTVTKHGASGSTTWSYKITAVLTDGRETDLSPAGTMTSGNAVLDGTNYNTISWSAHSGAYSYRIFRTTAGGMPATIGMLNCQFPPTLTLDDTGLPVAEGVNIPTNQRSGLLTADVIRVGPYTAEAYDEMPKVGIEGSLSAHGAVRSTGVDDFLMKGAGVELQFVSNVGYVMAFDRTAGVFRPLMLNYGATPAAPVIIGTIPTVDNVHILMVEGSMVVSGILDANVAGLLPTDRVIFANVILNDLGTGYLPYKAANVERIANGDCEIWASATDLSSWSEYVVGTSSVNRDGSDFHGGAYSCRMDSGASASAAYILQGITTGASKRHKICLWYKTTAGVTPGIALYNTDYSLVLQSNGTWAASGAIVLPEALGWTPYNLYFDIMGDTVYYLYLTLSGSIANGSVWLDDILFMQLGTLENSPIFTDGTKVNVATLPSFATDALAGTGGLTTGDLYAISGTSPLQLAVKI